VCFIDWQKAGDDVNWTRLMQILKVNGIKWCKVKLITKLYIDKAVKIKLDQGGGKYSEEWTGN
jgi:hypothetical protein